MADPLTIDELRGILARITFAPSCVDMGWRWDVRQIDDVPDASLPDPRATDEQGSQYCPRNFLIRTTFQRPDRDTGEVQRGTGGWHHVPADSSVSGIVKRAFVAAKMILEHELMESFRYAGARLFDPHHDIEDLAAAVNHRTCRLRAPACGTDRGRAQP